MKKEKIMHIPFKASITFLKDCQNIKTYILFLFRMYLSVLSRLAKIAINRKESHIFVSMATVSTSQ